MPSFLCSAIHASSYPKTTQEVVFLGKSNVGKSSLINALFGKIAYTGKTPGKTRLLNFFDIDGHFTVCDVPGYGYAKMAKSETIDLGEMMEEYFSLRKELKLAILIIDIRRGFSLDDEDMIAVLKDKKIPFLIAAGKCDKLGNNELVKTRRALEEKADAVPLICISAFKNINIDKVAEDIAACVGWKFR